MPPTVPISRSRAQQFDDLLLEAVEHLDERWGAELAGVEFVVEDVPYVEHTSSDVVYGSDVVEDGNVPLARLLPATPGDEGQDDLPPRVVIYRRPIETRSHDQADLADLVHDVVVEQVANLLGRDPDEIDPLD